MINDQGKCSALLTREGFFDFVVFKTQCNVSHNVAVVCQHDPKLNTVFNNNMSDVKVHILDGFYSIQAFASYNVGWFMVDNLCINFCTCIKCTNNAEADTLCNKRGGLLAHRVLNNVTISTRRNVLDNHTEFSLFWNMFHHIKDIINSPTGTFRDFLDKEVQKFIAVNGSE